MPVQRCEGEERKRDTETESYTKVKRVNNIKLTDKKREGDINTLKILNNIKDKNKDGEDIKDKDENIENIDIYVYIRIIVGVGGLRDGRRKKRVKRLRNRYCGY